MATNSDFADRVAGTSAADAGRRPGKRERLVTAARDLVHRQGIARTTLAEIADAADVPVGNVYYYFKTKDEIVSAVVGAHSDQLRAAFAELEHDHTAPADRLVAFVDLQAGWVSSAPPQYGCPYGTLSSELAKQTAPDPLTATLLELQLDWLEEQFRTMGRPDPRDLAVQLLAAWQGCAVLTSALGQPELMATEAQRLREWITGLDSRLRDSSSA